MYFLSDDESKHLLKGLLPKSRQTEVAEELRGWSWPVPPLEPVYDTRLPLFEVAGRYCPTGRDVYLRHVQGVKVEPTAAMAQGALLHSLIACVLVEAKRLIYLHGVDSYREILRELSRLGESPDLPPSVACQLPRIPEPDRADVSRRAMVLREFEVTRLIARIQELLARQPFIGTDSLAALAVPIVLEQKIDGSFLGLSSQLSVDAYSTLEMMILDTKFGQKRDFHRLTTTGYAMVSEAVHEYPVNVGCIVYGRFTGDRLIVEKDFHIIDDELRQWFVEERDRKARLVHDEIDPGPAEDCGPWCSYREACRGG